MLAGYLRVSRVGGREHLISPEEQREAIEEYARSHGLEVEVLPPELDVSGGKLSRPILDEILAGIHSGRFSGIIVKDLSRLSRLSLTDALALIEGIEGAGGTVISIDENFDASTPAGEKARSDFLSLHRMMRRIYGDRIANAKARAVREGIWPLPVVPVGYAKGADRRLVPGEEAAKVRRAFRMRAEGTSWGPIGLLLGRGASGARKVIRNRVYLGEINYVGERNPDAHEPLVDLATFEAAQLDHPAPARRGISPKLLVGVLRCTGCRGLLSPSTQKRWHGYRCIGRRASGECQAKAMIAASVAEPYLEHLAREGLRAYGFAERDQAGEIEGAKAALAEAESELRTYSQAVDASRLGAELVAEGLRSRAARVGEARRKVGEARVLRPLASGGGVDAYEGLSVEGRNHVLGDLGVVWVRKGRGPAVDRIKVSEGDWDLPRPGRRRFPILPVEWEDIEEAPWVLSAKGVFQGSG